MMTTALNMNASQSALHDRFARKVTTRLSQGTADLPYDITERLRAARVQALAKRKVSSLQTASSASHNSSSTLTMGGDEGGLWARIASFLPLIALIAGLIAISVVQTEHRANELAEVDGSLLTSDLPPAAYSDPGFAQFLKNNR